MTKQGHLRLPASVRHCCGLVPGDRVLLVADPDQNVLVVCTRLSRWTSCSWRVTSSCWAVIAYDGAVRSFAGSGSGPARAGADGRLHRAASPRTGRAEAGADDVLGLHPSCL
ncbi:AbrB/MazE/SpoVT family DNA-binding domain-containing protein [Allokutzneria sp. A3M-2-11 16]|uniref:AbrB/MazE/SpoVT family DNA-binding domain-containing protein n=1 Tax=Allokutzneria sp. A3M-2-11 16 TaxID=2962043 RepID=UPI0020B82A08|nr:AbrB/MazE/SpoVT family DNA-binding domain-containing protein [Allokutzneria sp. A3M-2-11 16]MCP3803471.1 AbrB/MazE/SpoVT family DNA-binding domain-containing protein [Allokutzneria sp. A3M-2-11 16]